MVRAADMDSAGHSSFMIDEASCLRQTHGGMCTPSTRTSSPLSLSSSLSENSWLPLSSHERKEAMSRSHSRFVADVAQKIEKLDDLGRPKSRRRCSEDFCEQSGKGLLVRSHSSSLLRNTGYSVMSAGASQAATGQGRLVRSHSATSLLRSSVQTETASEQPKPCRHVIQKACSMKDVFRTFAAGREQLYWKGFEQLCSDSMLFDGRFMVPDARRIFSGLLPKGQRSMGFDKFEELLSDVAFERQCTVDVVQRMALTCVQRQHCRR